MKVRAAKKSKDKSMLVNMAESIGTTLGKIAKKAKVVEESALKSMPTTKTSGSRKRVLKAKKSGIGKSSSTSLVTARSKSKAQARRGKKAPGGRKA